MRQNETPTPRNQAKQPFRRNCEGYLGVTIAGARLILRARKNTTQITKREGARREGEKGCVSHRFLPSKSKRTYGLSNKASDASDPISWVQDGINYQHWLVSLAQTHRRKIL